MAKFKVGDRVKVKGAGVETIKAVYPKGKGSGLDSTQVDMSVDWYETDGSGMIADEDIVGVANSRACNSTNPVVANAMAANGGVARNASEYETYMRFVKKYENEIKRVTMTLENFARECPSGATIESEADQVARMAKDVVRWIIETKTMSPADFDEF